jgi:hypothetical protein
MRWPDSRLANRPLRVTRPVTRRGSRVSGE